MKLALLGCDSDTVALVEELVRRTGAEVTSICRGDAFRTRLASLAPRADWFDEWETLAAGGDWDAVIVGRQRGAGDDVEPLRKLCQEGVTLVLSHPACDAITALELDMIRRDTGARLGIHFPGYRHPALRRLAELVAAGDAAPLGRVEQLVVERVLEQRDRPHVLEQLARDASLIRVIIGTITRVSATAPTTDASAWSSISVQMTGRSGVLVRWSLEPGDAAQGGRLSLIGVAGRATLTMPATDDWRLEFTGSGSPPESFPTAEVTQAICQTLARELSGQAASKTGPLESDWSGVCRDLEVADIVEQSLRRGKVIELHHETVTEEDTFKGVMSAIGCLLLILVPLILIVAVAVEGFRHGWHVQMNVPSATDLSDGAANSAGQTAGGDDSDRTLTAGRRYWFVCLLAPLLVFLLLQLLRFVFPSPPRGNASTQE